MSENKEYIYRPFINRTKLKEEQFSIGDSVVCIFDNGSEYYGFYFNAAKRWRLDTDYLNYSRSRDNNNYPVGYEIAHLLQNQTVTGRAKMLIIRDNIYNKVLVKIHRTRLVIFEKYISFKNEVGDNTQFVQILG